MNKKHPVLISIPDSIENNIILYGVSTIPTLSIEEPIQYINAPVYSPKRYRWENIEIDIYDSNKNITECLGKWIKNMCNPNTSSQNYKRNIIITSLNEKMHWEINGAFITNINLNEMPLNNFCEIIKNNKTILNRLVLTEKNNKKKYIINTLTLTFDNAILRA